AIADLEHQIVEFWRIPYDISEVQTRMRTARLPEPLIQRLVVGRRTRAGTRGTEPVSLSGNFMQQHPQIETPDPQPPERSQFSFALTLAAAAGVIVLAGL